MDIRFFCQDKNNGNIIMYPIYNMYHDWRGQILVGGMEHE